MKGTIDSDKLWEEAQKKTFRGWVNMHLESKGVKVNDLAIDLADGVKLIALLEVLNKKPIEGRYYKNPKSRPYRIDNVNFALNFIRTDLGVKLIGCSAEDIVDGNIKIVLGMLWRLIQKFQLGADNSRKELLHWCQDAISSYNLTVENFQSSFRDGLIFCALIHKYDSSLINFESLNKDDAINNLTRAFDLANEHLKITKLLEPKDVNDGHLDERSLMTYLSLWHKAFSIKFGTTVPIRMTDERLIKTSSVTSFHVSAAPISSTSTSTSIHQQESGPSKKEFDDKVEELTKLRKENQQLRDEVHKLQDELKAAHDAHKAALAAAESAHAAAAAATAAAAAAASEAPKESTATEPPTAATPPKTDEPPKDVAEPAAAVVVATPAPATAEPVVINLSDEEKQKFEKEIDSLKTTVKNLESKLEQANKASEAAQKELEETKEDFTSLQKKYKKDVEKETKRQQKKLDKAIKAKDKDAEDLKSQLEAEISKRDHEIKALKAKLKKAKKDVAEGQHAIAQSAIDKDVEEIKKEFEELLQLAHMFESEETSASRKEFQQNKAKDDSEQTEREDK